jgi:hypothetical protein
MHTQSDSRKAGKDFLNFREDRPSKYYSCPNRLKNLCPLAAARDFHNIFVNKNV